MGPDAEASRSGDFCGPGESVPDAKRTSGLNDSAGFIYGLKQAAENVEQRAKDRTLSGFYETAVEFKGIFMFLHS
jgi:hypothetical protein